MNWQQVVSLAIVALTAGILVWARFFRRRKFSFERDTHCGCSSANHSRPTPSVIYRARKGQRPEIIVKMK